MGGVVPHGFLLHRPPAAVAGAEESVDLHREEHPVVRARVDVRLLAGTDPLDHLGREPALEDRLRGLRVPLFLERGGPRADLPVYTGVEVFFVRHGRFGCGGSVTVRSADAGRATGTTERSSVGSRSTERFDTTRHSGNLLAARAKQRYSREVSIGFRRKEGRGSPRGPSRGAQWPIWWCRLIWWNSHPRNARKMPMPTSASKIAIVLKYVCAAFVAPDEANVESAIAPTRNPTRTSTPPTR